jgi:patatin-like phospholipase/acyl hydrolase
MICGTSTGGLIALGIAMGKPAEELAKLYSEHGNKIFPTSNYRINQIFSIKTSNATSNIALGEILE